LNKINPEILKVEGRQEGDAHDDTADGRGRDARTQGERGGPVVDEAQAEHEEAEDAPAYSRLTAAKGDHRGGRKRRHADRAHHPAPADLGELCGLGALAEADRPVAHHQRHGGKFRRCHDP